MNTIVVTGRDVLAAAIETAPLDQDVTIVLEYSGGRTTYHFPAVCRPDGSEVNRHGYERSAGFGKPTTWIPQFKTVEAHILYQAKRRKQIAQSVRRQARGRFE
jgi:hypothetical protein